MDTLTLKDCHFNSRIGIFPQERATKQPLILDIELSVDIRKAAKSDLMKNAIDYRDVHALVKKRVEQNTSLLVEALAEDVAQLILKNFPVSRVTLTVKKLKPMQKRKGAWFGVTISRST